MTSRAGDAPTSYWYTDADVVLQALRRFHRADSAMRRRMATLMGVGQLDLQALRRVIAAERLGAPLSPSGLSTELRISTAAVTKLVDRLIESGHVARVPHPHDRRSVTLVATPHAHAELRDGMGELHRRMHDVAARVPTSTRLAVAEFLEAMADVMDTEPSRPAARTERADREQASRDD
ncbi:MAG TPA: MarR family transcriptional regulator [Actinomycetales bacterium]|nr:MarR family transcriptional regulator [Actinomycetales bacterium]